MANNLASNPITCDTASGAVVISSPTKVRLIQWVDDNADMVNDATLVLGINGATVTIKAQFTTDVGQVLPVWYEAGPFNPGIVINSLIITTMATGNLLVWVE